MKPDSLEREIGARIRLWRERRGLTQEALAEKVGVQQRSLSTLELGTRPLRVTVALDLAEAFGITLQTLVTKDPAA